MSTVNTSTDVKLFISKICITVLCLTSNRWNSSQSFLKDCLPSNNPQIGLNKIFHFFLRFLINFCSSTFAWCQFSPDQSLSRVRRFATPRIAPGQASLSITNSQSLLKLMPIESVIPSSHLILCRPLILLPPISPSIRVFSKESTLHEVAKY